LLAQMLLSSFYVLQHFLNKSVGNSLPGVRRQWKFEMAQYEKTFDNSKAHKLLAWEPLISLEDAIGQIAVEYRNLYGWKVDAYVYILPLQFLFVGVLLVSLFWAAACSLISTSWLQS
ncbi:unnamed protein product, partial [Polarella glacialis]